MKFTIEKNILINSLENVVKAIDSTNIYIHLRNIYVSVLDDYIIFKGSNGYFSIENKIDNKNAEIQQIGDFLIPANIFINIIKKCNGKITLFSEKNILYIQNEKDKFEVNLLNIEDYPNIDFSLYGNKIKINAEKLKKAIDNVIFSTSSTSEDIILSGVNIKYNKGQLILTATDSFRLSREIVEITDDRDISFDVTVVNKNIKNFIPSDIKSDVLFYVNEHKINLIHENTNYQSKIVDAPYKMVDKLFEVNFNKVLEIDKNIFSNAISKATVLASETSFNKITLSIDQENIKLFANTDDVGRTNVIIESNKYKYNGDPIKIILNYKFLKEAINVFSDKIRVNLLEEKSLIMIDSEKSSNKQIISPMSQ